MSDRMLSDEILLGIINSKSGGGGGGGTDDYNDLKNQPQINGNTLIGNKTASDLGLVAAETGKGLSTNDYTDADKAIVGGVTAALAGKQDALTAGNNIKIDDDTISVNRWAVPAGKVVYTVITSDENYGQNVHVQRHTLGGALIDDRTFFCEMYKTTTIDDLISIYNPYSEYRITLLKNSDEQQAGYMYVVSPISKATSTSFTFMMEQEENDNDLIIREELDAVSSAVSAIKDGQSIDSFADVETALADKQDATDNNLDTEAKTIVGAINEHEDDIDSLKSGLTNLDVALSVPDNTGKNVLPLTLDSLKEINSNGTWAVNVYTKNSMTFTVSTNTNGYVTAIVVNGTADVEEDTTFNLIRVTNLNNMLYGAYILNGCPSGGDPNYQIYIGSDVKDKGNGVSFSTPLTGTYSGIRVKSDYTASNLTFHPMIRLASVSDPTFAPYIPSVETRLENVESELASKVSVSKVIIGANSSANIKLDKTKIYDIEMSSFNNSSVYNYYHEFAIFGTTVWTYGEISKIESSTVNVALTFTIDSNDNLVITNIGNYGANIIVKIATVAR